MALPIEAADQGVSTFTARKMEWGTVVQSGHLYFQTPPGTEFTTCKTPISYLTQNLLPVKQQSPISHRIYHLIICNVVGDIRFTTSNTTIFYFTQDLSPHMEIPCDVREN